MQLFRKRAPSHDKTGLKRLEPEQLFNQLDACLMQIFNHCNLIKPQEDKLNSFGITFAYDAVNLPNLTDRVSVKRYSREDGVGTLLCRPVNDFQPKNGDLGNLTRGQIRDALTCYVYFKNKGVITESDRYFIPLCQIEAGRAHFVLMMVVNNQITLIDSKSEAGSYHYPTTAFLDRLKKLAKDSFYQMTVKAPVFIGHQTILNDVLCGHYVMSYIIQLSQADTQKLAKGVTAILEDRLAQDVYTQRVDNGEGFIMLDIEASSVPPAEKVADGDDMTASLALSVGSRIDTFEFDDIDNDHDDDDNIKVHDKNNSGNLR